MLLIIILTTIIISYNINIIEYNSYKDYLLCLFIALISLIFKFIYLSISKIIIIIDIIILSGIITQDLKYLIYNK